MTPSHQSPVLGTKLAIQTPSLKTSMCKRHGASLQPRTGADPVYAIRMAALAQAPSFWYLATPNKPELLQHGFCNTRLAFCFHLPATIPSLFIVHYGYNHLRAIQKLLPLITVSQPTINHHPPCHGIDGGGGANHICQFVTFNVAHINDINKFFFDLEKSLFLLIRGLLILKANQRQKKMDEPTITQFHQEHPPALQQALIPALQVLSLSPDPGRGHQNHSLKLCLQFCFQWIKASELYLVALEPAELVPTALCLLESPSVALAFGSTVSPVYRWLKFGHKLLLFALQEHPAAKMELMYNRFLAKVVVDSAFKLSRKPYLMRSRQSGPPFNAAALTVNRVATSSVSRQLSEWGM
eukprot:jgi/Psemu1/14652/gm1.14652_g